MPVEQLRTILLISLIAVTFLLWQAWMVDYGPKPTPVAERAPSTMRAEPSATSAHC